MVVNAAPESAAIEPAALETPEPEAVVPSTEFLYLTGRPRLKDFLHFVRSHATHAPRDATLTDTWMAAEQVVRRLEQEEAGRADGPSMSALGPEYEPLLVELLRDPLIRHGFNTVPTDIAMVELDRLVVHQKHIDLSHVRQLQARLGSSLGYEEVFRVCLPHDHPQPPVKWSRAGDDSYVFVSPSSDLRFLGTMSMKGDNVRDYPPPGTLVGVVGLAVGFGSNFLNAFYAENRLILNNGSHRAYALRSLGVTHVPCIVQHVSSRGQLDVVGSSLVRRNPERYLEHPRPSMLVDYFDRRLHLVFPAQRRLHQVTVTFEVTEIDVPAL